MNGAFSVNITPNNQLIIAEILKEKFRKRSPLSRLLCRFGFHNKREYERVVFCSSCFLLISGNELDLQAVIETAKFQAEKSTILLAAAYDRTFAYEDHCESIRLEDVMTLEILRLVRENLKTN